MSILDGLRPNVADTYSLDQLRGTDAWDLALDRVAEALTSDAAAKAILHDPSVWAELYSLRRGDGDAFDVVRAVLAAAAGGDQ